MFIDQFLQSHPQILISKTALQICRRGETLMRQSQDPYHDDRHLQRLLKNLGHFLRQHSQFRLNFSVLLMAICWHDTWKAGRQTFSPLKLIYYQIYEGLGSSRLFNQSTGKRLPTALKQGTAYAIRKHAQFQFLPFFSLEAKVLQDLDDLDILNQARLRILVTTSRNFKPVTRFFYKMWLNVQTRDFATRGTHFPWTRDKLLQQNQIAKKFLKLI